ncbi:CBS domain-containing protein CBSCBSPB3-like [Prosopis cineraria]|uniref:CBS domain-containing protein CBSCBSPB3-like n=1 Tax=Prosopis cineraria TaxID=364024 RepID=UPI002410B666|nr:CBS domain-containing protein CBSCBSPB3-like [Prosopis cineraria]
MSGLVAPLGPRRNTANHKRAPSASRRSLSGENGSGNEPSSPTDQPPAGEDRSVKKLRLSKALTIPEGTTVSEACRRMATRHIDAVLLTDANALLSGIVTDKDIAARVIAEGLRPEQTIMSKIMTRNPIFLKSDSMAIEALQKMVQGKFRHLPVVENGEVIALLDITKCLYDAIVKMEKASEQGSAISAAVGGLERQRSNSLAAPNTFIETLRDHVFKPSLSTIIGENAKVAITSVADPVYVAAKRMRELHVSSAIIAAGNKILGILTSKDILMRVVAQNLSPELTLVEKVMTPNPQCASLDTTILEALHMMHEGKFLHLPLLDRDGNIAACVDVLQISQAAIAMVESSTGGANDISNTVMQKFWDSAFSTESMEDFDSHSEFSGLVASEGGDTAKSVDPSVGFENSFSFKFEDLKGHVHRFNCGVEHFDDLLSAVMQRIDHVKDGGGPQILYEDDEGDKIFLANDNDLAAAVNHARSMGMKALRLHLEYADSTNITTPESSTATRERVNPLSLRFGIIAGAVVLTSIGVMVYLKRSKQ